MFRNLAFETFFFREKGSDSHNKSRPTFFSHGMVDGYPMCTYAKPTYILNMP